MWLVGRKQRLSAPAACWAAVLAGLVISPACSVSSARSAGAENPDGGHVLPPSFTDAGVAPIDATNQPSFDGPQVFYTRPCWGPAVFTGPLAFSRDVPSDVAETKAVPRLAFDSDGRLVLAVETVPNNASQVIVQKLNGDGTLAWEQRVSEVAMTLTDMQVDASDRIWLLFGRQRAAPNTTTDSFRLVALSPAGDTVVTRSVQGPGNVLLHLAVSRDAVVVAGSNPTDKLASFLMWFGVDGILVSTHAFAADWIFDAVAMDDDRHVYVASHADVAASLAAFDDTGAQLWRQDLGTWSKIQSLELRERRLVLAGEFRGELALGGISKKAQSREDLFIASLNTDASARFIDTLAPNGLSAPSSLPSSSLLARDDGGGGVVVWGWTSDRIAENGAFAAGSGLFLGHADAQGGWTASASFPLPWSLSPRGSGSVYALAADPQGRVAVSGGSGYSVDLGGLQLEPSNFITLFQVSPSPSITSPSAASPPASDRAACPVPSDPSDLGGGTVLAWSSDISLFPQVKIHGAELVWATDAELFTTPVSGGPIVRLAHGQRLIGVFAVAGDDVVWTRSNPAASPSQGGGHSELLRLPRGAATPVLLANDLPPFVNGLAATGDAVYWSGADDMLWENGRIGRVTAGVTASEIMAVGSHPKVAQDGDTLYWAMTTARQDAPRMTQVFRGPPSSSSVTAAPALVAAFEGWVNDLAADAGAVVWMQQVGAFSYLAREDGSLFSVSQPMPQSLALSHGDAFFIDRAQPVVLDALGRAIGSGTLFELPHDYPNPTQLIDHVMTFAISAETMALVRSGDNLRWALTARSR